MPKVGNKKFAYTFTGMKKARAAAAKRRLEAVKAEKAKPSKFEAHKLAPAPKGSGWGEGEEAKLKKAKAKYRADRAKKADHTGPTSGKDLMKLGGDESQSSFNVKKEYSKQRAAEGDLDSPSPHHVFASAKKAKKEEAKFQSKLKETRYLADAKAAREGLLDLKGTKAPSLPKNWRSLDKNSGIRQLFREWYKVNRGKKAKTKKPKINLRKHLARFERATGQK